MKTSKNQTQKINRKIANIKSKSDAVIANAGKDAKKFKDKFDEAFSGTRNGFIKDRIKHHATKLKELNEKLQDTKA